MTQPRPELISFNICPFVQRVVILLNVKGVEHDVRYIDLANKPDWFLKISPYGKVPLLHVGEHVLFESAIINEYLDEVYEPQLLSKDPLERAYDRGWIHFAGEMLGPQYVWMIAKDVERFEAQEATIKSQLAKLEEQLGDGPFFHGELFTLVDASIAPALFRYTILEQKYGVSFWQELPKVRKMAAALWEMEDIQSSVPADFHEALETFLHREDTILRQRYLQPS
jgi:glutathione S-transferase